MQEKASNAKREGKSEQVVNDIVRSTRNPKVRYELADLSRYADILETAERWVGQLHLYPG